MSAASRREERRIQVLESAANAFLEYGYVHANLDRIAEQAGVSKPTLYAYFGDKFSLFEATLLHGVAIAKEDFSNSIRDIDPQPQDVHSELVDFAFRYLEAARANWLIFRLEGTEVIKFPELMARIRVKAAIRSLLADKLAEWAINGTLAINAPNKAAHLLLTLIEYDLLYEMIYLYPRDDETYWETISLNLRVFIDHYRSRV